MKKLLLSLILSLNILFVYGIIQANLSLYLSGKSSTDLFMDKSFTFDINTRTSPSLEYLVRHNNILYGIGCEKQLVRNLSNKKKPYNFTNNAPFYATAKFIDPKKRFKNELDLQIGYNLYLGSKEYEDGKDLKGGLLLGIGTGISINKTVIQLMFKHNNGENSYLTAHGKRIVQEFYYDYLSLSVGYRFE